MGVESHGMARSWPKRKEDRLTKSTIADAMSAVFERSAAAFMPNWDPEVTHLAGVTWDPQKTEPMTMPVPTR